MWERTTTDIGDQRPTVAGSDSEPTGLALGWLLLTTIAAVVAVCWIGAFGTSLGAIGQYRVWLVLTLSALATAASMVPIVRSTRRAERDRWAPVALAVALAAFAWNLTNLGEHVVVNRDPGSYASTAEWLAGHGELRLHLTNQVVAGIPGLVLDGPATYAVTPTTIEFQFNHAPAAVFAIGSPIADGRGLFAMPALVGSIGLLAVYLTIRAMCRNGGIAVAATAAVAVSLPYLYVARDTYSETFVMATLWTGLAVLQRLTPHPRSSPRTAYILLGALFGATSLFRVDAGLYVIALIIVCALLRLSHHPARRVLLVLAAAAVPAGIGALDARILAGRYFDDLSSEIQTLVLAQVLSLAALAVLELTRLAERPLGQRFHAGAGPKLAGGLAAVASSAFVAFWLIRPAVSKARGGWNETESVALHLAGVQKDMGQAIEPWRSYGEQSLTQFVWYFGLALVAAAAVGIGVLMYRAARKPTGPFAMFTVVVAIGAPYYLWNPSITPDHLWSTRRYAPFIVPALAACAAIALDALVEAWRRRAPRAGFVPAAGVLLAVLAFVGPTVWATWPVRNIAEHRNFAGTLRAACDSLGPNAVVVTIGYGNIAMPLRAWCGAEVMSASDADARDVLAALRDRSLAACQPIHVVSNKTPDEGGYADLVTLVSAHHGSSFTSPEFTVGRRPDRYRGDNINILVSRIPLPASCSPVS